MQDEKNNLKLLYSNEVEPYDSINFLQFVEIDIATLENAKPGNFLN